MEKEVLIIGGGVAGLCSGAYLRMNGYKTTILEMGDKPGGLCMAWDRKGYTVDGCLHWFVGSTPQQSFYKLWEELGVIQGKKFLYMDSLFRIEKDKTVDIFTNIDRLEEHMVSISPEDVRFIKEFCRGLTDLIKLDMPVENAPELSSPLDGAKMMATMLPFMKVLKRWGRMSISDFAANFKNTTLRNAWLTWLPPEFSLMAIMFTIAWMHKKAAGYIIGGSMEVSNSLEKRYLDLGGTLKYKTEVAKIIVEKDRAVGVRLVDGSELRADYVISAADGYTTVFDWLDGKYVDNKIRGYYDDLPIFKPLVYVGLGINRDFSDYPQIISGTYFSLPEPVEISGKDRNGIALRIHNFDSTLAPKGKTLVTMMVESEYGYWAEIRKDLNTYRAKKEAIAQLAIKVLDMKFPGAAAQVEMTDVSTPVTFKRYTGNWQGSYEGWLPTPEVAMLRMSKTLPGLDSLYMVGQWVAPGGGLPSGAMTGRHIAQILCHRDKREFVTTKPA